MNQENNTLEDDLLARIRRKLAMIKGGNALVAAECGELLMQAKDRVQKGQWAGWLAAHWKSSPALARSYMQIHRERDTLPEGWENWTVDQALKFLRPQTEDVPESKAKADASESKADPGTKTPRDRMESALWNACKSARELTDTAFYFHWLPKGGMSFDDARPIISRVIEQGQIQGGGGATIERSPDKLTYSVEDVVCSPSANITADWIGNGIRVTLTVEIVDRVSP